MSGLVADHVAALNPTLVLDAVIPLALFCLAAFKISYTRKRLLLAGIGR